jgi:hypothetical protein
MKVEMSTATIDTTYGHLTEGDVVDVSDEVGQRWVALGIAKESSGKPTKGLQAGEGETPPLTQEEAQKRVAEQELAAAELHGDVAAARARTLTQAGVVPPIAEEPSGGPAPTPTTTARRGASTPAEPPPESAA